MTNPRIIFAVFVGVLLLTAILVANDNRQHQLRQSPSVFYE